MNHCCSGWSVHKTGMVEKGKELKQKENVIAFGDRNNDRRYGTVMEMKFLADSFLLPMKLPLFMDCPE